MNDPLGERGFDQLAGLLLAYLLGEQEEGRALGEHGAFGGIHVGLHGAGSTDSPRRHLAQCMPC